MLAYEQMNPKTKYIGDNSSKFSPFSPHQDKHITFLTLNFFQTLMQQGQFSVSFFFFPFLHCLRVLYHFLVIALNTYIIGVNKHRRQSNSVIPSPPHHFMPLCVIRHVKLEMAGCKIISNLQNRRVSNNYFKSESQISRGSYILYTM